jgi:predicted nucleic acid-binding protein
MKKMSLGDTLIAATVLDYAIPLATRNTKNFAWIPGLSLINPMDI